MKRMFLALLTVLMLVIPAYATEAEDDSIVDQSIQQEPVVVGTLEELQAAVDAAKDGDTIYLDCTINMEDGDTLITDKHIILRPSDRLKKKGDRMIDLYGSGIISGFTFYEDRLIGCSVIHTRAEGNGEIIIENCIFDVYKDTNVSPYIMVDADDTAKIRGCTFYCGNGYVIYTQARTNVLIDSCIFLKRHYYNWMLIATYGDTLVENCIFGAGTGHISTALNGNLKLSGNNMMPNFYKGRIYPNVFLGGKVASLGKISILDQHIDDGWGFYDLYTGEKIELPLIDMEDQSVLSYMSDVQAEEYFSDKSHLGQFSVQAEEKRDLEEEELDPEPSTTTDEGNPADTPQQPGDQTGDDYTIGGDQPPQESTQPPETNPDNPDNGEQEQPQEPVQPPQDEPTQPPEGENKDNPADNPPESPEQPVEPSQDDKKDNPTDTTEQQPAVSPEEPIGPSESNDPVDDTEQPDIPSQNNPTDTPSTTPDTPEQPQEPADGDSSNNDNYTPPTDYYPSYRPLRPVVTVKPTEGSTPQTQPDSTSAPAKPQLACNGAVIDTSRTVVLLGYGDGLLHEDDPLTRAQLATIVYRLLDDESIVKYSNAELAFADVPDDAWYTPYVRVIQAAGIVNGVGGGRYDPNSTVTWAQIVTILTRFVEPQEYTLQHISYEGWAQDAIQTAVALGWIEDSAEFTPDTVIGRGELVQLVNNVLALYW